MLKNKKKSIALLMSGAALISLGLTACSTPSHAQSHHVTHKSATSAHARIVNELRKQINSQKTATKMNNFQHNIKDADKLNKDLTKADSVLKKKVGLKTLEYGLLGHPDEYTKILNFIASQPKSKRAKYVTFMNAASVMSWSSITETSHGKIAPIKINKSTYAYTNRKLTKHSKTKLVPGDTVYVGGIVKIKGKLFYTDGLIFIPHDKASIDSAITTKEGAKVWEKYAINLAASYQIPISTKSIK